MDILSIEEVLDLQFGEEVTYHQKNAPVMYRRPMQGVVQYVNKISENSFNVLISVRGSNVIASTDDYIKSWYLTK